MPASAPSASRRRLTVTFLRLALRGGGIFALGERDEAELLVTLAAARLREALAFVEGDPSELARAFQARAGGVGPVLRHPGRAGAAPGRGRPLAQQLADRARRVVRECAVG